MLKIILNLILLAAVLNVAKSQRPPRFITVCNGYAEEEIYYTGVCSLRFPYVALGQIADFTNSMPNEMTVDTFIREHLFIGTDEFFRQSYENVITPINFVDRLDALIVEALKLADTFLKPGCLNQQVAVFMDPFYNSTFSDLRYLMFDAFFELFPEGNTCGSGGTDGFCPRTQEILKIEYSYEIYERTIYNLLQAYESSIFAILNSPLNIAGKTAFDNLINKVNSNGIGQTYLSDVKAFTTSTYFGAIRDFYLNETDKNTPVPYSRTTTPKPTRPPRTTRESVIDVKAVDDVVLYLLPSLIAFLGIGGAIGIIVIVYNFKPVVVHVNMQPIVNGTGAKNMPMKTDVIQMENMPQNSN